VPADRLTAKWHATVTPPIKVTLRDMAPGPSPRAFPMGRMPDVIPLMTMGK